MFRFQAWTIQSLAFLLFSWYFGKGLMGRIRIFVTYCVVPFSCQTIGFILHTMYGYSEKTYIVLVCMSYSVWISQTFFKTFLRLVWYALELIGKGCFKLCTVEAESVVTDDNIIPV